MAVAPPAPRSTIVDSVDGLLITIPARTNWFVVCFLLLWLGGWYAGETSAIREVITSFSDGTPSIFLIFWLLGWTIGGLFAGSTVAWMLYGRERILLRHDALVIGRTVFGLGRTREYDLAQIRRLRIAGSEVDSNDSGSKGPLGSGMIAFDYGATTVRFGASIDEAEGRMLIQRLAERHAFDVLE